MSKLRIAIIGAGPCGLSQLLAFKQAEQEKKVELICFERQSDWGGLWHYTSHIGIDIHGEPIHSSMYRYLWSNNPKETFEYVDYTFYDHFGCFLPSFLPRACIYDYLIGRAKHENLRQYIRFNTVVRHVDFDDKNNEFNIKVEDLNIQTKESMKFDRVIVATGHYHVPNMINIDGVEQFPGRVIHSHEFRGADEFIGLNLLIIGGALSAEDITLQCYKYGAQSVICSSHQGSMGLQGLPKIKEVPMIVRMENRKAYFEDGSSIDNIDAIIFCTGYRHSYPFMAERLCLQTGITDFIPANLYKGIFWIDQPYVAYLGSPRQIYTFSMFDIQAAIVRDVFLNYIQLPDKNHWQTDINEWKKRDKAIGPMDIVAMVDLQTDYLRDLLTLLGKHNDNRLLSMINLDQISSLLKNYFSIKYEDILNFRDISFESVVDTKNKQIVQVTKPWIKNMDDSIETILNDYRNKS